ncbi:MAG: glycosyltransferase [Polyangiales bacterium]
MSESRLVLFSHRYPSRLGASEVFLDQEYSFVRAHADNVLFAPIFRSNAPSNDQRWIDVDPKSIIAPQSSPSLRPVVPAMSMLFREISGHPLRHWSPKRLFQLSTVINAAVPLALSVGHALRQRNWQGATLYAYWFDRTAFAAVMTKALFPDLPLRLVARAHRGDLYEDAQFTNYLPFQRIVLEAADLVACISAHGAEYLRDRFDQFESKIVVRRLGTFDAVSLSRPTEPGRLRLVSCSNLIAVKRVDRIARVVQALSTRGRFEIHWTHFGDGPERANIEAIAREFPRSVHFDLRGQVDNTTIRDFYATQSVDLFINLSLSEGIPVSIMEASSHRIATLATDVGGVSEIVNNHSGRLIQVDTSIASIADAIVALASNKLALLSNAEAARTIWSRDYRAKTNYELFARELFEQGQTKATSG